MSKAHLHYSFATLGRVNAEDFYKGYMRHPSAFQYSHIEKSTIHQTDYQMVQTIRPEACAASFQTKKLRTFACFPLSRHRGFYFPPPAKGWRIRDNGLSRMPANP